MSPQGDLAVVLLPSDVKQDPLLLFRALGLKERSPKGKRFPEPRRDILQRLDSSQVAA
jgi:hypothetical protein